MFIYFTLFVYLEWCNEFLHGSHSSPLLTSPFGAAVLVGDSSLWYIDVSKGGHKLNEEVGLSGLDTPKIEVFIYCRQSVCVCRAKSWLARINTSTLKGNVRISCKNLFTKKPYLSGVHWQAHIGTGWRTIDLGKLLSTAQFLSRVWWQETALRNPLPLRSRGNMTDGDSLRLNYLLTPLMPLVSASVGFRHGGSR